MRVRFGEFTFDSSSRELTLRGEPRALSTKAFLLLELLIGQAPRAIRKEELYRHIWGETFVDEANLPNLISEIRAALGETRKSARFIKTVHGFGYGFSGDLARDEKRRSPSGCLYSLQWRREEFPLHEGENVIGRGDDADVMIDSGAISRRHARIVVSSQGATLADLESKNGTFLDEAPVTGPVAVRDGQEIRLGVVSLTFRSVNRGASTITHMKSPS